MIAPSRRLIASCLLLMAASLLISLLGLAQGPVPLTIDQVFSALFGDAPRNVAMVVNEWRLPRVLMALLIGAALGVSGAIFQSLTRNPLGSPDVMGFNTGAWSGVLVAMVLFGQNLTAIALAAMAGGVLTSLVVWLLAWRNGIETFRLIIIGIGVRAMLVAFNTWLLLRASLETALSAGLWNAGSLNGLTWGKTWPSAPLILLMLVGSALLVRRMRLLEMGDDTACALGVQVERSRLLLMLVGILGCDGLLTLINTPEEVFADSALYLDIYVWGLPFVFFYNIATGVFSALGDSKTPFIFLAASSLSNIAVDILFVTAFKMGVAGVAWATFLCQGISCVLAVAVVIRRLKQLPSQGKPVLFSGDLLGRFVVIAIPSVLQQSFISVGNILIQSVINRFGTDIMAGYSASVKLNNLVITSFTTIGNGISNYAAQNLGAGKLTRIQEGFRAALKMVWLICLPLVALYCTCGRALMNFFMEDATEAALGSGMRFLWILSPFYFVVSAKLVADGILRGTGKMRQFMTATFTDLILRVVLAFVLSGTVLASTGIWCAWPIGWTVATVISILFYRKGEWNTVPEEVGEALAAESASV